MHASWPPKLASNDASPTPQLTKRGKRPRRNTEFARRDKAQSLLRRGLMMGEETFHPDTRALLAYGRALAGGGVTPKKGRADHVLDRLVVIERTKDGRLPIRTFGAELVGVFGADLRDHDFSRFFLAPDLKLMHALIDACEAAGQPGIIRVTAESVNGMQLGAEILVTPLRLDADLGARFLVLFQALGGEAFLDGRPIQRLRIGSLHPPEAKLPSGMRLVVVND